MKKSTVVDRGTYGKARRATDTAKSARANGRWTFLTGHASVLLHIAGHADDTLREIAARIGLTERTTASIVMYPAMPISQIRAAATRYRSSIDDMLGQPGAASTHIRP